MFLTRNKDTDLIILFNLDDQDLFNFSISNPKDKYLKKICKDETFWRNRLKNKFLQEKEKEQENFYNKSEMRTWKETYLALVYYLNKYSPIKAEEELVNIINFSIEKGLDLWNYGIFEASKGNIDIIDCLIQKDTNKWDYGMYEASKGGIKNIDLIDFFIQKGANNWNYGMTGAAKGGNRDLVEFFIQKGADNWNKGMYGAARGGNKDLVQFFIEKGATDWKKVGFFIMLTK